MKRLTLVLIAVLIAGVLSAADFTLEFLPFSTSRRGITIAGYGFNPDGNVFGICSYYTFTVCSGRGCQPKRIPHPQTCTWDLQGHLLTMVAGEPIAPAPISVMPVAVPPPGYGITSIVTYAINSDGVSTGGEISYGNSFYNEIGFVSVP